MKIFLAGFPGCGKTFLGKQAAALLELPFFDTDEMIGSAAGISVPEIFSNKGEEYFRGLEADIIRSFSSKRKFLVATGGGLPCSHDNMHWMNNNGITLYLEASAAFLFHRLLKEKKSRPLIAHLTDIELMIYITETLAARNPVYKMAHITVNAETCTPAKLVSAIKNKIVI